MILNLNNVLAFLATLGPIGYVPAPGTVATALTIGLLYVTSFYSSSLFAQIIISICALVITYIVCRAAVKVFGTLDPAAVVMDEVCGTILTFVHIPFHVTTWVIGFLLFRFFDISKCCGLTYLEKIGNGLGVMLDDVAAGILSNVILRTMINMGIIEAVDFAIFWIRDTILR